LIRDEEDVQDEQPDDKESSSGSSDTGSSVSSDPPPVVDGNAEMTIKPKDDTQGRSEDLEPLDDDICLLASPWVKGLDLRTKEWGKLA
jgi:hypothetical protein